MRKLALLVSFALFAPLALFATGCAEVDRALVSPSEYERYRHYRFAEENDAERLSFAWAYLRAHPRGAFHQEVESWFTPKEASFFSQAGQSASGASKYLELMPDGPHAAEERAYLAAVEKEKIEAPLHTMQALQEARKRAEAARKAPGEAIESWTRRALALTTWQQPIASMRSADKSFADALSADPPAVCDEETCKKTLYFTYLVPDSEPPVDRTVPIVVRVDASMAHLSSVTIVAPHGGFTWWMEGTEGRSVEAEDEKDRTLAVARAKNRVETLVRETLGPTTNCTTTEEPATRTIDCGKVRVVVSAQPTGEDIVRVIGA